jgi:hypothetical protein
LGQLRRYIGQHATAISIILALVFGVIGAYSVFHERTPSIVFQVLSTTDGLDVKQPPPDLEVLLRGLNMQSNSLNLRIYRINIGNTGEVEILQGMDDANNPWGLRVENAQIVDARVVDSNAEYLASNVRPSGPSCGFQ